MSIEFLLDRFGESNRFRKKCKKKFRDIQQINPIIPKMFFQGNLGDVLGTSRINLSGTSRIRQISTAPGLHFKTFPGCQIKTSPGRQFGTSPGWSNRIFRGRPGDVGGGRPWDILGTNICWLGSSSVHIDGRNKNILVVAGKPTQGLDNDTITTEAKYPIDFTE